MRKFRIFISRKKAEQFAKKHNGNIVTEILGTGIIHYEVWYEEEGDSDA